MTDYKFIDVSDDVMDMVVDAEFSSPFPALKAQTVFQEVVNALEIGRTLRMFFEGLSAFQITEKGLEMNFRFSRNPDDIAKLNEIERDELPRTQAQFVFHVFARIDRIHELGSVPFPADFRNFIEFPAK